VLNKRLEAIAVYLKQVGKNLARGDSTDHTHRPALQQLIQQLQWLKDRKGRRLSHDDLIHYQGVVVAIKETIPLMSEIDKAIRTWPIH
jgi:hypothetical protein